MLWWWWCWCQVSWIRVRGVTLHCFILLSSSVTRARHSTLLSLSILFWINKNVWFVIKKSVMRTVMINQNHKILIRISSSYWLNRCDSLHCQCSQRPVYSTGVVSVVGGGVTDHWWDRSIDTNLWSLSHDSGQQCSGHGTLTPKLLDEKPEEVISGRGDCKKNLNIMKCVIWWYLE